MSESDFEGWDELFAKLDRIASMPDAEILAAAIEGAKPIVDEANQKAPGKYIVTKAEITPRGAQVKIGPDRAHWYYRFYERGATKHEIRAGRGARREANMDAMKAGERKASKDALLQATATAKLVFVGNKGLIFASVVHNAGGLPAAPFLRPALDGKSKEAIQATFTSLLKAIVEI